MISPEIQTELSVPLARLHELGYSVTDHLYSPSSFGNWYIDLDGPKTFRIVKDRGQYFVDGDRAALESFGLWRAFDNFERFVNLVLAWAASAQSSRPFRTLTPRELTYLFERVCLDTGICLPTLTASRIVEDVSSPAEFARSVLAAEGLDPDSEERSLLESVMSIAIDALGTSPRSV